MPFFFHNHPKTQFFCFFLRFSFSSFFTCSLFLSFFNITKTKTRNAFFPARNIFSHPYTLFVILNCPKNTKIGERQANKNLGQMFDAALARCLTQKRPNIEQILTLHHICVYTHKDIHKKRETERR